ncbi:hypothetical protein M3Y98_01191700 [Aphelenchoides besseyi]|nr:hypothetical protein M3Y98_01191700 [Aphelenchoides besseyi]KAI6195052.1 hypothetical protein M3Y96_01190100 [Aphelenchoides besseyi]
MLQHVALNVIENNTAGSLKLQQYSGTDNEESTSATDIALYILGGIAGLILLIALFFIIGCVVKRYCGRLQLPDPIRPRIQNNSAAIMEPPADNYYTADQFEHRGPLEVRATIDPTLEIGDHLPIDTDKNPKDARFKFTDGPGNVVFDIGQGVEVVVDDNAKKTNANVDDMDFRRFYANL